MQGPEQTSVAQFDFDAGDDNELSFRAGDAITILEHVGDDWLRGRLNGKEGLFPKAFVKIGDGGGALPTAKAVYDFEGEESDELTFKVIVKFLLLLE